MNALGRALILGGLHLGLLASLGVKLRLDRALRPRAWARVHPVDPDLPIRGRYVSLSVEVPLQGPPPAEQGRDGALNLEVRLRSRDGLLVAEALEGTAEDGVPARYSGTGTSRASVRLAEPLAFFIPEHVTDPSRRGAGESLWAELTLPRRGPVRPIRLAVKQGDTLTPLDL